MPSTMVNVHRWPRHMEASGFPDASTVGRLMDVDVVAFV